MIEDFQPKNSSTDCERYSTLMLLPVEGTREFLHRTGVALIDRGHGAGWRGRLEAHRFGGDVSPDCSLIRLARATRTHRRRDLRHLFSASQRIHDMIRRCQIVRRHLPTPGLDT